MKRTLLIGIAAVVVIVVGAVILLYSNIDSIVKAAVEEAGSRATKTTVTLQSVKISPTSGEGTLNGFRMGNPEGFKTESAIRFGTVSVKIDVGSLTRDAVLVKEVIIAAPQITYELAGSGSNIATIQKNVEDFAGASGAGKPGEAKPAPAASEDGKKVIIENLYIRDGKVGVSATFLGGKQMSVPLPAIHLKDIGKEKGGASPAEVAEKILTSISDGAKKAVDSLGLDKMMDKAREGVEGTKKLLEGGAGGAQKTIEEGTKGVGDAVKGLFNR